VLASGDPGFFGIVRALAERVGPQRLDVRPAATSVAVAFARLGLPWDDALVVSAHGRDPHAALAVALRHPKVAILTGPDAPPAWFAQRLPGRRVVVAERLGTPDERIREDAFAEAAQPNVVLVLDPDAPLDRARVWPPRAAAGWALPESAFAHRAGLITKAEVRALALAQLGPGLGDLVWDVGCGSGSVAVECARLGAAAIGIDHDPEAIELTTANARTHGVPVQTVAGRAPGALADLPDPDAVFVGGGGADLDAILDVAAARTRRVIVVTLALIERAGPVLDRLAAAGLNPEATLLQANRLRALAGGHRLAAENPVVVAWGRRA
jgi:precorrin-6Y C5,15-methyltransferase (decarboxylating)